MKYIFQIIISFSLIMSGVGGCASQTEKKAKPNALSRFFDLNWAENKFWDDGLAEVATYAAERTIYNKPRSFDYTLITVKEDFNRKFNVKTDDYKRNDLFPVMKVNQFCRIQTENYPYHFLTSLFFNRENPIQLHKLTSSSQEWCGNTFKTLTSAGDNYRYAFNSYWDGQGEGQMSLESNLLFEDQLPYTLRSLNFKDKLNFTARVAELLQTNKATKPAIYLANFVVTEDKSTGANPTWKVSVLLSPEKENNYWFEQQYPNILVKQTTWDNRNLQLKEIKRNAYWQH